MKAYHNILEVDPSLHQCEADLLPTSLVVPVVELVHGLLRGGRIQPGFLYMVKVFCPIRGHKITCTQNHRITHSAGTTLAPRSRLLPCQTRHSLVGVIMRPPWMLLLIVAAVCGDRPTVTGSNGIVSCTHHLACDAGAAVLRDGGNALGDATHSDCYPLLFLLLPHTAPIASQCF